MAGTSLRELKPSPQVERDMKRLDLDGDGVVDFGELCEEYGAPMGQAAAAASLARADEEEKEKKKKKKQRCGASVGAL